MASEILSSRLGVLTRRRLVCIGAAAGMATFARQPACAIQGERSAVPIALPDFLAGTPADAGPARVISAIIGINLARSGRFVLIDQAAFPDHVPTIDEWPRFADWRAIKAVALLVGRVARLLDGRINTAFRLWDVSFDVSGPTPLIGRRYAATPANFPRIGNIISDEVYEALLGVPGHFDANASPR
jgi:TolB protein